MKVAELRQFGTTGVDAAKTQLELIEFCSSESNIFWWHTWALLVKGRYLQIFSTPRK